MKFEGIWRNFISSQNLDLFSCSRLRCLTYYRAKPIENWNSDEKLKLEVRNIKCLNDGLSLYRGMGRMRPLPSIIRFNQLLSGVVKLGEYSAAACLFRDFCNLGIPINEHTMTIAIDTYCLSNRVDFGFSILGSFFKRGCVPDAFTFCTLLKGLFRESRSDDARELFTKITRDRSCELNVVVYGTVIDGFCKSGGVAAAMELLRVMEKGSCKPDTHIYSMVIDALCKGKLVDSALKLFDEMSEKGTTADLVTYTTLICGLCNLSRWEEVEILLKQMIECKVYPNVVTFNSIIDALCKEGLVDGAEHVVHIMKQKNVIPNLVTYSALMHGYCLQGRVDEGRKVFDSMVGDSIAPDVRSFSILINCYCKNMRIEEAMDLLHEMKRKGLNPNVITYTSMLRALFRGGRGPEARKLFDELQAAGMKPDFHTYCTLLDGLFYNGHSEEGLLLLDGLEQKGNVHISYYNVVMNAYCKDKKLDRVRAVFSGLGSKGLEPNVVTYNILIKACCQDGLVDEAKDLVLLMGQRSLLPNGITFNCIIQACLEGGEYDVAAKFMEEMVDKGFSPDSITLELVLSLSGAVENNPTLLRMAQKVAPNTFGNRSMSENAWGAGDAVCSCVVIIGADFKASTDISSDFIIHPFGGNLALIQHRLIGLRTLSQLRVFEHSFLACVLGFGCACRELGRFSRLWLMK